MSGESRGIWFGLIGMLSFSLTLPATRVAVQAFDPVLVTLARALLAAVPAAFLLWATRQRWPTPAQWRSVAVVTGGVVLGFPLLAGWAMLRLPSAHGAIVLGLLPLASAGAAMLRAGERPSAQFWAASLCGSGLVLAFAASSGAGGLHLADLALAAGVLSAAVGYAEGGRLARELGSWQVICWALVLAAPAVALPLGLGVYHVGLSGTPAAWAALAYLALFSQLFGFFAWYRGLALGGIARVSQLQLIQPFVTVTASWLLVGETVTWVTWVAGAAVMATVAVGRRAPVRRLPEGNTRAYLTSALNTRKSSQSEGSSTRSP